MAESVIKSGVRFDLLEITMDCTNQGQYEIAGAYTGQHTLTTTEENGASFLVPLFARKAGYEAGPSIAVEKGVVRLMFVRSISNVQCGILRVYTN